jgi:transposase InsO family protein
MNLEDKCFPLRVICRVMGISRSSYYRADREKEVSGQPSHGMVAEDEVLVEIIREIQSHWPCYGVRRVCAVLRFDRGLAINIKRVRRVMRLYGLLQKPVSHCVPRRKHTGKVAVEEPDKLWGTDLTKTWTEAAAGLGSCLYWITAPETAWPGGSPKWPLPLWSTT